MQHKLASEYIITGAVPGEYTAYQSTPNKKEPQYLRIVTKYGNELAYWSINDWTIQPENLPARVTNSQSRSAKESTRPFPGAPSTRISYHPTSPA